MSNHPAVGNAYLAPHVKLLNDSYRHFTGRQLIRTNDSDEANAKAVFEADFIVLSSGTETDPLFNYANRRALALFELEWESLIALPARESAEPLHQQTRAKLMQQVIDHGFIDDYSGTRISSSGRRFVIEQATVWNVIDRTGIVHGQAATFSKWIDV
jgi:hypothetical protein